MGVPIVSKSEVAWWRTLSGYHWFVLAMAALAWLFDTMDQQIFALARLPAVTELLGLSPHDDAVKRAAGWATMVFMLGWATGGIVFGILGDRLGRVKTMVMTIVVYSAFTGLSAFSYALWDFALYRFLSGLGVGGEFAVGVALVAEAIPEHARVPALGLVQACSAVGNVTAAGVAWIMSRLRASGTVGSSWRAMFLVGVLPALLAVLVMRRLREPERWTIASSAADKTRLGSLTELFGTPRWRRNAIAGLLLASAGVIGLWGISFFVYDLVRLVLGQQPSAQALSPADRDASLTAYVALASLLFNTAGFFGVYSFSVVTQRLGRRPTFALSFLLSFGATVLTFWRFRTYADVYWMMPLMGFCVFTLFGGYAIYFPELFPTRLRSTGTSFCYNVGRYIAAPGALGMGLLATTVYGHYGSVVSYRYAGVTMCAIYVVGLAALPFAPETKGQPLPE